MDNGCKDAIRFEDVSLGYGNDEIVAGLNARVPGRGITALLGQNGCGKTTVMRSLIKHIGLRMGKIYLNGDDIDKIEVEDIPRYVSYAPAELEDVMGLRVIDLVSNARKGGRWMLKAEAALALREVGIGSLSERMFNELSTGQKKLSLIARSLAISAPIALLDEPTSGLDPTNKQLIYKVIRRLARQQTSILIATHDLDLAFLSDYVVALKEGALFKSGTAMDVLNGRVLTGLYDSRIDVRRIGGRRFAMHIR